MYWLSFERNIPINTHIRADFRLLIFNQLINLAAKYRYMFGGLFEVPAMFRMIIGRSWGQGAQHSQSLQSCLRIYRVWLSLCRVLQPLSLPWLRHIISQRPSRHVRTPSMSSYRLKTAKTPLIAIPRFALRKGKVNHCCNINHVTWGAPCISSSRENGHRCWGHWFTLCFPPGHGSDIRQCKKTGNLIVADTSWQLGVCAEINRVKWRSSGLKKPQLVLAWHHLHAQPQKHLRMFLSSLYEIVTNACELVDDKNEFKSLIPENNLWLISTKHFRGLLKMTGIPRSSNHNYLRDKAHELRRTIFNTAMNAGKEYPCAFSWVEISVALYYRYS